MKLKTNQETNLTNQQTDNFDVVAQRNWVSAANSNFLIPISLKPDGVNRCCFKLRLFALTEFKVWNTKDLQHRVAYRCGDYNFELVAKTHFL